MRRKISKLGTITIVGILTVLVAIFSLNVLAQVNIEEAKKTVIKWADDNANHISEISYQIWEYAELGLTEFKSSDLLVSELEQNGFEIERGLAGMPTSFVGTYSRGKGKPVIGILAEYDALPNGHSCGHNLFGAGSVAGAIALKEAMEKHNIDGTIKLFGTQVKIPMAGRSGWHERVYLRDVMYF